jgi:hypothetical protein
MAGEREVIDGGLALCLESQASRKKPTARPAGSGAARDPAPAPARACECAPGLDVGGAGIVRAALSSKDARLRVLRGAQQVGGGARASARCMVMRGPGRKVTQREGSVKRRLEPGSCQGTATPYVCQLGRAALPFDTRPTKR